MSPSRRAAAIPAPPMPRSHKDFLSLLDLDPSELDQCLELAAQVKIDRVLGREAPTVESMLIDEGSVAGVRAGSLPSIT